MTGRFAVSLAGHDRGVLYVIVAEEGDFVYLSDGRLKPPDRPKKKRRKHIQPMKAEVDRELMAKLSAGGAVPSSVTTVQSSSSHSTSPRPMLIMGSTASVIPGRILGPFLICAKLGICGSS